MLILVGDCHFYLYIHIIHFFLNKVFEIQLYKECFIFNQSKCFTVIASRLPNITENVIQKEDEEDDEKFKSEDANAKLNEDGDDEVTIDNPYLNPIIMPDVS